MGLVWFCLTQGFPFDRANQTLWILSGLVAASIGRPLGSMKRIFLDWVPFIAVLYAYDYSRHLAIVIGRPIMVTPQIDWDTTLFLGTVPVVWLQQHFYDPASVQWFDSVASLIYVSHFVAVWAIAAVLYMRDRREWFLWARALVVLSFAGLITFIIVPSAPPWWAAKYGYLPDVERIATRGLDGLGIHWARQLIDGGAATSNDVAAIPSLHTGFAVLIAVLVLPAHRRALPLVGAAAARGLPDRHAARAGLRRRALRGRRPHRRGLRRSPWCSACGPSTAGEPAAGSPPTSPIRTQLSRPDAGQSPTWGSGTGVDATGAHDADDADEHPDRVEQRRLPAADRDRPDQQCARADRVGGLVAAGLRTPTGPR